MTTSINTWKTAALKCSLYGHSCHNEASFVRNAGETCPLKLCTDCFKVNVGIRKGICTMPLRKKKSETTVLLGTNQLGE